MKMDMLKGVTHTTKFGTLEIVEYRGALDVLVRFVDTGYEVSTRAEAIRKGTTKDKLKPSIFGVGFIGDGEYKTFLKGKRTVAYEKWYHMMERCYCPKHQKRYPTYIGCSVDPEWHNFQNFASWLHSHDCDVSILELDKDGIIKGNSVYSPSRCKLVTKAENIDISQAKRFTLISPEGVKSDFVNLNKFCRERNLCRKGIGKLILGEKDNHRGWTACDD